MDQSPHTLNPHRAASPGHGAFFDVDNTLIPGRSIEERFFHYLWGEGLVGFKEVVQSLRFWFSHMPPVSRQPLREFKAYLVGKQPSIIEPLAKAFVESEICPQLSAGAVETMRWHQELRHKTALVTASLDFLVHPVAQFLAADAVLAAIPERSADRYTGHILPPFPYGLGKRQVVEAFALEHGLDLQQSFAYGDSPGDKEILRIVGYPLVVNPIRGMAGVAKQEGWPVVRWGNRSRKI